MNTCVRNSKTQRRGNTETGIGHVLSHSKTTSGEEVKVPEVGLAGLTSSTSAPNSKFYKLKNPNYNKFAQPTAHNCEFFCFTQTQSRIDHVRKTKVSSLVNLNDFATLVILPVNRQKWSARRQRGKIPKPIVSWKPWYSTFVDSLKYENYMRRNYHATDDLDTIADALSTFCRRGSTKPALSGFFSLGFPTMLDANITKVAPLFYYFSQDEDHQSPDTRRRLHNLCGEAIDHLAQWLPELDEVYDLVCESHAKHFKGSTSYEDYKNKVLMINDVCKEFLYEKKQIDINLLDLGRVVMMDDLYQSGHVTSVERHVYVEERTIFNFRPTTDCEIETIPPTVLLSGIHDRPISRWQSVTCPINGTLVFAVTARDRGTTQLSGKLRTMAGKTNELNVWLSSWRKAKDYLIDFTDPDEHMRLSSKFATLIFDSFRQQICDAASVSISLYSDASVTVNTFWSYEIPHFIVCSNSTTNYRLEMVDFSIELLPFEVRYLTVMLNVMFRHVRNDAAEYRDVKASMLPEGYSLAMKNDVWGRLAILMIRFIQFNSGLPAFVRGLLLTGLDKMKCSMDQVLANWFRMLPHILTHGDFLFLSAIESEDIIVKDEDYDMWYDAFPRSRISSASEHSKHYVTTILPKPYLAPGLFYVSCIHTIGEPCIISPLDRSILPDFEYYTAGLCNDQDI